MMTRGRPSQKRVTQNEKRPGKPDLPFHLDEPRR
jgi:hypothetical protein